MCANVGARVPQLCRNLFQLCKEDHTPQRAAHRSKSPWHWYRRRILCQHWSFAGRQFFWATRAQRGKGRAGRLAHRATTDPSVGSGTLRAAREEKSGLRTSGGKFLLLYLRDLAAKVLHLWNFVLHESPFNCIFLGAETWLLAVPDLAEHLTESIPGYESSTYWQKLASHVSTWHKGDQSSHELPALCKNRDYGKWVPKLD